MMMLLRCLLFLIINLLVSEVKAAATAVKSELKRIGNLDYLDVETVEYYLSAPSEDYDVVILYYAQWCSNCHAFAPIYDQIARLLKGGTAESRLIFGLFDCESSTAHAQVCQTAGVTHYPTIQFISLAGDGEHLQRKQPRHTSKYAANWQYGDAVLDWIQALSRLSQWHRAGWGKRIRTALFGNKKKKNEQKKQPLPLGVPAPVKAEHELSVLQLKSSESEVLLKRSSIFVDVLLFPKKVSRVDVDDEIVTACLVETASSGKTYTDVYAYLHKTNAWTSTTAKDQVVRTCAAEVALDYCGRLSTQYMENWLDSIELDTTITEEVFQDFQKNMTEYVATQEPFCPIVDECALTEFADIKCKPEHCPFTDESACRYLTACLTEQLQQEYADAMQLSLLPNDGLPPIPDQKSGGFSWGL